MQNVEITSHDHGDHGEYHARVQGSDHIGRLTWVLRDGARVAEHTLVPPEIGGRGVARELVEAMVADALGMATVLCHPLASVLSAYGMGLADRRVLHEATLGVPLDAVGIAAIEAGVSRLGDTAEAELAAQGIAPRPIRPRSSRNTGGFRRQR